MTSRQRKLLAFISDYQRVHEGVSPSYADMRAALGTKSNGAVHQLFRRLSDIGYVRRTPGTKREILILKRPDADVCPCCGRKGAE